MPRANIKELTYKEFGGGILSAIDFSMDIVRQPDLKGDRVNVVLSGKFLSHKLIDVVAMPTAVGSATIILRCLALDSRGLP